jgi:hypothetical protein
MVSRDVAGNSSPVLIKLNTSTGAEEDTLSIPAPVGRPTGVRPARFIVTDNTHVYVGTLWGSDPFPSQPDALRIDKINPATMTIVDTFVDESSTSMIVRSYAADVYDGILAVGFREGVTDKVFILDTATMGLLDQINTTSGGVPNCVSISNTGRLYLANSSETLFSGRFEMYDISDSTISFVRDFGAFSSIGGSDQNMVRILARPIAWGTT